MIRVAQQTLTRRQKSRIESVSAPVDGLNARDPVAELKPNEAIKLNNMFCTPYDVTIRKGYSSQATGLGAQVNTLASYAPTLGSATLFAWSSDKIYDITAAGAIGAAKISGNASSTFQTVNFGTAAGVFLVAASGADLPLIYNGTVWSNAFAAAFDPAVTSVTSVGTLATVTMANPHNLKTGMSVTLAGFTPAGYNGTYVITVTGASTFTYVLAGALGVVTVTGTATPTINAAITGVNPALLIQPAIFKTRLWFVEKNSSKVWYLPSLSIGGAAASIDFSNLFTMGGSLVAMADWSLDAGYGIDDYAVFISSKGQVAIYKGTDPASSSTWSLVGVYDLGAPIGRRCFQKYAGDLTLISQDGVVPLSHALMSTRVNTSVAITDKVQHLISSYTTTNSAFFGWQTILFPKENMLFVNVPTSSTTAIQFVTNTISGAWSTFSDWNAFCWVLHDDNIYFGASTFVGKAWDTLADNGNNINFEAQQSFNYFGNSQLKQVMMARPVITSDGNPSILFGTNVDFDTSAPTGIADFYGPNNVAATWNSSLWDIGIWRGDPTVRKEWQTAFGIGYAISAHMVGSLRGIQFRWSSTDFMLQNGGML